MESLRRMSVAILALALTVSGCGGKPHRCLYEKAGGFSYDPPPGWTIAEFPGLKYRVSAGKPENEFAPNINVVDEKCGGGLSAYADATVENTKKLFTELSVVSRDEFKTDDGLTGIRVIMDNTVQRFRLRQTFFIFTNGDHKYVVTSSALSEGGEDFDDAFMTSMKTFRLH